MRLQLAARHLVCKNPSGGKQRLESIDLDKTHRGHSSDCSTGDRAKPPKRITPVGSSDSLHLRLRVFEPRKDTERCPNDIFEA